METSTTVVTGASRGFGRALATALVERGRHVVGVARDAHDLAEVRAELGALFDPVAADATDPDLPGRLLREHRRQLDAIVVQLLEHESLDEPEIYAAAGIARSPATPVPAPVPASVP